MLPVLNTPSMASSDPRRQKDDVFVKGAARRRLRISEARRCTGRRASSPHPKRRTEHKSSRNPQGGLGREADQSVSEFPLLREKTEPAAEREKEGERGDEGHKRSTRAKFRTFSSSRLVCSKQGAKPSAQPVIWDMTSWTYGRGGRVIARLADHRPSAEHS